MTSAAVLEKAERLRSAGRVRRVSEAAYLVTGDHGTYAVELEGGRAARCDCQAYGECSHMYAVAAELRAEREPASADPFDYLLDPEPADVDVDEIFACARGEG